MTTGIRQLAQVLTEPRHSAVASKRPATDRILASPPEPRRSPAELILNPAVGWAV
jgi:hypothetical protein